MQSYFFICCLCRQIRTLERKNLTTEVKVTVFKELAVSKIIHLVLVINIPITVIKEFNEIQKVLWRCKNPKVKHRTL